MIHLSELRIMSSFIATSSREGAGHLQEFSLPESLLCRGIIIRNFIGPPVPTYATASAVSMRDAPDFLANKKS